MFSPFSCLDSHRKQSVTLHDFLVMFDCFVYYLGRYVYVVGRNDKRTRLCAEHLQHGIVENPMHGTFF